MKIMEKAKRFFTLNAAKHEGFTLVELIVVIAILAILAGVAVPAYSGYIEKSKRAGDETLLAAVNKAFASACLANNKDVYEINSATVIMENGVVKGISVPADYNDEFLMFYEGNTDSAFQVITNLAFDSVLHMFVDPSSVSELNISYGGGSITVSKEQYDAIAGTTFVTNENLGVAGTLDKVGSVSNFAAGLFGTGEGGTFEAIASSEDFNRSLGAYLGIENADTMEFSALQNAIAAKTGDWENLNEASANALIMYAADNVSTKLNKQSITELLTGENPHKAIVDSMSVENDPGKAMAQAAMAYGLYTAYAYQSGNADLIAKADAENPTDVLLELDDPDFQAWVKNDGQKDVDGYIAALDVIGQGSTNSSIAVDIMQNGFDNDQLKDLLGSVMG